MDQSDLWTRVMFGTLFTMMAAMLLKLFLGWRADACSAASCWSYGSLL